MVMKISSKTKECFTCKRSKAIKQFDKDNSKADGLGYDCKKCRSKRRKVPRVAKYCTWCNKPLGKVYSQTEYCPSCARERKKNLAKASAYYAKGEIAKSREYREKRNPLKKYKLPIPLRIEKWNSELENYWKNQ